MFDHPWPALEYAARTWPDAEALVFPHQDARLSFRDLHRQARAMAAFLAARGMGSGDHITLIAENRWEWPVVQMACAGLGAVFIPLNSHYRREDLAYALRQSRARAVICSRAYRGNPYFENMQALRGELADLADVICLDDAGWAAREPDFRAAPQTLGALLFTSGTTGFARGALLSHRAMMMNALATAARLDVQPGDRWTSIIPLFHCAGCIMNMLGCLQAGAAYVGVPSFDPETMFRVIDAERCTHLSGVPTSYLAMLDHPARGAYDLTSLKAGSCGGADANPDVLKRCAEEFPMPGLAQVYGQTEGSTLFTCPSIDDSLRWETAGLALPGYELRVVDPGTFAALPPGEIGEIQARGPMVMECYFDMEEATAETITDGGWLRTGDLGFLRSDGRFVIAGGRLRDMIIRGGENIYPAEIENILQQHPSVSGIAVFGIKDAYYGETVAAAVALASPATAAELSGMCKGRIAKFKVPSTFYRVEKFPLTASGKIRKVALREKAAQGALDLLP